MTTSATASVDGYTGPGFEPVRRAFLENFNTRNPTAEVGASFAVMRGDRVLVDLWGGFADRARERPWTASTVANTFSSTKGVASACTALLESQGRLDYGAPVARYWPEFAQGGKGAITVETLLSHQAGLSGVREPIAFTDLYDWDRMVGILERAEPLWPPNAKAGYHAITWGFLAGELVRRIDGRSIGQFLAEELTSKLGADYVIGVAQADDARVAEMIPAPPPATEEPRRELPEILRLTLANPIMDPMAANQRAFRAAELPALNGTGTALGLARIYAPLANDGAFGARQIYAPGAVARAARRRFSGVDMVLGVEVNWRAGFYGNNQSNWYGPNPESIGHSGWGGSMGFADPVTGLSVGYVPNQMDSNLNGDPRSLRLVAALYECLGHTKQGKTS